MYVMQMPLAATLVVSWLTMFLVGTELFVISPLLPMLAADYGVSPMLAGWCVTAFSLTYMGSVLLLGHISDRVGRRRVLIWSLLAFGAANLLTAAAPNLSWLIAARSFAGAAAAGVSPSIYALVGAAAPPNRRAAWLALPVSGLLVALALGASVGTAAGAAFGWASVFIALAAASLVLARLNCRIWPCEPLRADAAGSLPKLLTGAVLARRLMPTMMWGTSLYGVYTYLGTGLTAAAFAPGQVARAILWYGCAAIAGALIGGCLADRAGAKFTAGVSLAGLCGCLLLLRLALGAGAFVELALGLSSAVAQLFFPAQQAGLARDFPARSGTVLAWNNSALFLGIALGSLIGGRAAAIGGFDATLSICAGIALAGSVINFIVVPSPTEEPRIFGLAAVTRVIAARCGAFRMSGCRQSAPEARKPAPVLSVTECASIPRTDEGMTAIGR
jgi:predicted MFS family arabinose efflux permease